jgi:hypothetical protein
MKYQPPFEPGAAPGAPGIYNSNPAAPYVNGNPATAQEGSIPPMEAVDHPMRELVHLITHSGQTPSHTDLEQVRKAIRKMIDTEVQVASVGGGIAIYQGQTIAAVHQIRSLIAGSGVTIDTVETAPGSGLFGVRIASGGGGGGGGDVTQWQRLPIFPEFETVTNKLSIADNGNGTLTVGAAQNILWRGWSRISTDSFSSGARTVTTVANKTYHLRLARDGASFVLKDLSDGAYNPAASAESHAAFDSTYDDALIARIVTNASNVATVTTLANKYALRASYDGTATATLMTANNGWEYVATAPINWARAPSIVSPRLSLYAPVVGSGTYVEGGSNYWGAANDVSRYAVTARVASDWNLAGAFPSGNPVGQVQMSLAA